MNTILWRSAILPGWGQISAGAPIKGAFFLISEIIILVWAWRMEEISSPLTGLWSLGTKPQQLVGFTLIPGDHSLYLLVDGLTFVLLILLGIGVYILNLQDAKKLSGRLKINSDIPKTGAFFFLALAPAVALLLFFTLLPLVVTGALSFTNYRAPDHLPPRALVDWVGFTNFGKLAFLGAWQNTLGKVFIWNLLWALGVTGLGFFAGLGLSGILHRRRIPLPGFWRTLFILPYALPAYFSLLIFKGLFSLTGPVNEGLTFLTLGAIPFLTDPLMAKITVVLVNIWLTTPFFLILTATARKSLDQELYDLAALEGVGRNSVFFRITLPLVWKPVAPAVLLSFFFQFNNLAGIYLLTGGNPGSVDLHYAGETDILISLIYKLTLYQGNYSLGAALTLGLSLLLILSVLFFTNNSAKSTQGRSSL